MQGSGSTLRPLGLGEVLDRAVNLCVRFFVPLALIYVVYAVPIAILTFYSTQQMQALIAVFMESARRHSGQIDPTVLQHALGTDGGTASLWPFVAIVVSIFLYPLPTAALVEATTAFYLGRTSGFAAAYRVALDRYWNIFGINLLLFVAGGLVYVVFVLVVVFAGLAIAALASASHVLAIALGAIVALIGLCAFVAAIILVLLGLQIAYFSCVVERVNFAIAWTLAIKRVFNGIGLRRSLLVGLIYLAIALGIWIVTALGEVVLLGFLHSAVIGTLYQTVVRIATAAFTTAFIGIFYLDLRVREEGLDLQMAAERMSAPAQG